MLLLLLNHLFDEDSLVTLGISLGYTPLWLILSAPFLHKATRCICHYSGQGEPVSETVLRQQLLEINPFDAPIQALVTGKNLIVRWNYVDAKWWGILSRHGRKKTMRSKYD